MNEGREERSENIRQMFDAISPKYDLLNRLLSFGRDSSWRRRGINRLAIKPGACLLDVACGTGDVALTAYKKHKDIGKIIGVDFSADMLKIAEMKFEQKQVAVPYEFVKADARELPFENESVDIATIAFGIRNVVDVPKALSEMFRVLKQSGRLLILEFSEPRGRIFGPLFKFYFNKILPTVGGWISGRKSAYQYLPKSVSAFYTIEEMTALMLKAGFKDVLAKKMTFGITVAYIGNK